MSGRVSMWWFWRAMSIALAAALLAGGVSPSLVLASPPGISDPAAAATSGATGGVSPPDPGFTVDPTLAALKYAGQVSIDASGQAVIESSTSPQPAYASSAQLNTTWTAGSLPIWEPKGNSPTGGTVQDDLLNWYKDGNYWNFCSPGAIAVTLYYWANATWLDQGIATQYYAEPNYNITPWADTAWKATDSVSHGRGAIMYLAEEERPSGVSWTYSGIVDWSTTQIGTPIDRVMLALNWEASGETTTNYYYIWTYGNTITSSSQLLGYVEDDISHGVPLVVDAATAYGTGTTLHLPFWNMSRKIAHSVAVVGYNNTAGTYTVVDTCGPGCNSTGHAAGAGTISQSNLYTLMKDEGHVQVGNPAPDGIVW